jgi:hypothetical protein
MDREGLLGAFAELFGLLLGQFGVQIGHERVREFVKFSNGINEVELEQIFFKLLVIDNWVDFFYDGKMVFSFNEVIQNDEEFGFFSSQSNVVKDIDDGHNGYNADLTRNVRRNKLYLRALNFKFQKIDLIFEFIANCFEFLESYFISKVYIFYKILLIFRKQKNFKYCDKSD